MSFREIRLHSDKPPQEFSCDLLHHQETYAVLRYVIPGSNTVGAIAIEKGSDTIAHYWEDRNYILWIFKKPDTAIIGYLFHIARDVEIGEDYVRYVDLELDIWFSPDGKPTVLDEDEVKDSADRDERSPQDEHLAPAPQRHEKGEHVQQRPHRAGS